jgi:hypothetical protein
VAGIGGSHQAGAAIDHSRAAFGRGAEAAQISANVPDGPTMSAVSTRRRWAHFNSAAGQGRPSRPALADVGRLLYQRALMLPHLCHGRRRPAIHVFADDNYEICAWLSLARPGHDAWVNLSAGWY